MHDHGEARAHGRADRRQKYSDELTATAGAAANKAPLLLTPAGAPPTGLLAEITCLGAAEVVVVVGGENTISASTLDQMKAAGRTVSRIGGADRYKVSRDLIADPAFRITAAENVFIATGTNFPDALTASPAAITAVAPVLLVNGGGTNTSSADVEALEPYGLD